jgi:hypothetical protein
LQVEEGFYQCSQLISRHVVNVCPPLRGWHRLAIVVNQHEPPRLRIKPDVRAREKSSLAHVPRRVTDALAPSHPINETKLPEVADVIVRTWRHTQRVSQ